MRVVPLVVRVCCDDAMQTHSTPCNKLPSRASQQQRSAVQCSAVQLATSTDRMKRHDATHEPKSFDATRGSDRIGSDHSAVPIVCEEFSSSGTVPLSSATLAIIIDRHRSTTHQRNVGRRLQRYRVVNLSLSLAPRSQSYPSRITRSNVDRARAGQVNRNEVDETHTHAVPTEEARRRVK